jgi:hypothetical protein
MAGPKDICNTYEEDPDELKNLLNCTKISEGVPLTPVPTRASLLETHDAHLGLPASVPLVDHSHAISSCHYLTLHLEQQYLEWHTSVSRI